MSDELTGGLRLAAAKRQQAEFVVHQAIECDSK